MSLIVARAGVYDFKMEILEIIRKARTGTEYAGLYDFTFGIACEFFFVREQSDYYNWRHNNRILASIAFGF